jgi:Virulence-associated protein E/Bifunctional DNA primase/polymerase, N-terminal
MRTTPLWPIDPNTNKCTCPRLTCGAPGKHIKHEGWREKTRESLPRLTTAYGFATGPHITPELRDEGPAYVALDVDVKNGKQGPEALAALCAGRALPPTYMQRTPSGGWHAIYTYDWRKYNIRCVTDLGQVKHGFGGLDIRGNSGMVVGAGTVGKDGVLYTEVPGMPSDPQPAPAWLCEALHLDPQAPSAPVDTSIYIAEGHKWFDVATAGAKRWLKGARPAIKGEGGDASIWATALECVRWWGLTPDLAASLILASPAAGDRTQEEVLRKCESAAQSAFLGDFGQLLGAAQLAHDIGAKPVRAAQTPTVSISAVVAPATAFSIRGYEPESPKDLDRWTMPSVAAWIERTFPGRVKYDTFSGHVCFEDGLQVFEGLDAAQGRSFTRADACRVQAYLQGKTNCVAASLDVIHDAVWFVANSNRFDSLYDLVNGFDGTAMPVREALRIVQGFGEWGWLCDPTDAMARLYTQMFFVGAIARGMGSKHYGHPVQHQIVPILIGGQGEGKTLGLRRLFGESHIDGRNLFLRTLPNMDKEFECTRVMRGHWGMEFGEFSKLVQNTRDEETLKDFVTRDLDANRRMRADEVEIVERRTVAVGSTNDCTPFSAGGALRRYLPIKVQDARVDLERITRERTTLWTAAKCLWQNEYRWWMDRAETEAQTAHVAAFRQGDIITDALQVWLVGMPPNAPVTLLAAVNYCAATVPSARPNAYTVQRGLRTHGYSPSLHGATRDRVWRRLHLV